MSVLRRWDDLDSSNEEEVTIDETSYIEIWQKISFCVTNKVEINALQGYSTFVTDEMSQNTLNYYVFDNLVSNSYFMLTALPR